MEKSSREAEIVINGVKLTEAQSMAVRCAIESFDSDLTSNGLGEDDLGKSITKGYRDRLKEVRAPLYKHVKEA